MSNLYLLLLNANVKMGVLAIILETINQVEAAKGKAAKVPEFQSNESIVLEQAKRAAVHSTVDKIPVWGWACSSPQIRAICEAPKSLILQIY